MNIQWSKLPSYTWSCLWNLHFLLFLFFLESHVFGNFKFNYVRISRQNYSMEGDEGDIFSKAPVCKLFLLLKIKIKQNPGCQNKEYNATFEHIYRIIMAYPTIKKVFIDQWLWKCYCISGEIAVKQVVSNKCGLFQIHLGNLRVGATARNILLALLSFKLGNGIYRTYQTETKLLCNGEHFFFLKTGNLIFGSPSQSYKHTLPERPS